MRVAFSRIKITPKNYYRMSLAGYERPDPCLGILDEIHAYGILIEDDKESIKYNKLILISIDILKLPYSIVNYIKKGINQEFSDIKEDHILLHATHTHSAPDLTGEFYWPGGFLNVIRGIMFGINRNDKYIVFLKKQIKILVRNLYDSLQKCQIAWKKKIFNPNLVINRRHPREFPEIDLGVVGFKNFKEELIGILINYACHPTTLSWANNKISADYPGKINERIRELTADKVKSIYFNGPSGDLNPITTCGTDYEKLGDHKKLIYDQMGTYLDTIKLGYRIAEEALNLTKSIPNEDYLNTIIFKNEVKQIIIPFKDARYMSKAWFLNKLYHMIKKLILMPVVYANYDKTNFPIFNLINGNFSLKCKSIVQYFQFFSTKQNKGKSSFDILNVPGELFYDLGILFYEKSPNLRENTFIFQNVNDWIAYLFPLKEYKEVGGYEPVASFGPLCGYYVEKKILNLFEDIKNNIKKSKFQP